MKSEETENNPGSGKAMQGKVVVITGGASGMGRIAARELAAMGAVIVFNDREIEEGHEVCEILKSQTGNDNIEFVPCDMIDRAQVRAFADHVLSKYSRLDVLINNAGFTDPERILSSEGIEQHMAVMHVNHWLLTELLADRLRAGDGARVLQITSEAHKAGPGIDFDDMACDKVWKGKRYANTGAFKAYHRAKLAMVYAMQELAERFAGSGVTVNCISPGYFVGTNVFRHCRGFIKFGVKIVRPLFADPEKSAQTYVYLASSPEVEGITGKYWEYCKQKETSPLSHDEVLRKRLVEWTERQLA